MSSTPAQGEIWWAEAEAGFGGDAKRRGERADVGNRRAGDSHHSPGSNRGSTGPSHGLPDDCVASFDNLQPIRRSFLTQRAGELQIEEVDEICRALSALADC